MADLTQADIEMSSRAAAASIAAFMTSSTLIPRWQGSSWTTSIKAAGGKACRQRYYERVFCASTSRGGDLGVLPVVVGLVVIWTVMQILNPVFLSSTNLVNLTLECVPVGVIALGVGFMLLVGQIDLSVGSLSGMAAAVTAILFVGHGFSPWLAVPAAVVTAAVIGWLYAQVFNRLGVPSFVITLAGLLGFLGLQLWVLGAAGSINLPFDSGLVTFAQLDFLPPWLSYTLIVIAAAALFATGYLRASERRAAGLPAASTRGLLLRSAVLLAGLGAGRLVPGPYARRGLDVRAVPRARPRDALCADAHEVR